MCDIFYNIFITVIFITQHGAFFSTLAIILLLYFLFIGFILYSAHLFNFMSFYTQNLVFKRSAVLYLMKLIQQFIYSELVVYYGLITVVL